MKYLVPINKDGTIPVIEFAEQLDQGKVSVGISTDGKSKLLTFSVVNADCRVGDKIKKEDVAEIFGLLFHRNESIDVVIKYLEALKKMKIEEAN